MQLVYTESGANIRSFLLKKLHEMSCSVSIACLAIVLAISIEMGTGYRFTMPRKIMNAVIFF